MFFMMIETEEDRRKFITMYKNYRNLLYWAAHEIVKDEYLAEDVVHDAFERIARDMTKIHEAISPETRRYLYVITRNVALDYVRERTKRSKMEMEYTEDLDIADESELPPFHGAEDGVLAMKALRNLPELYCMVFMMKYIDGMENSEIADRLGIREGTVRQRLARGKVMLRKEFERLRQEEEERGW